MSLMGAGMPSLDPPDELPCDSDACRFGPHSVPNGDGTSDWVFYDDGYNNIDKCGHCLIDFTRDAEQYTGLLWDCTVGKECQYSEENTMCNDANTFVYELVGKPCIQGIEIINENMNDYCGHKVGAKNCPKYVYGYCFPGNDGSWGCQPPLERNDWVMFSDYCSRCEFQEFENVCYKRYHPPTQNSVFTCTALENCRTSNDETRNFDNKDLFYDFGPGLEDPCPNGLRCCEKDDQIVFDPVYVDSPSVPSGQSGNCVIPSSLERPDGLVIEESDIPNALKTLGLCIYNDDTKDYAIVTGQDLITLYAKEISEDYSYTEANYQEEISKCDWGDISYNNMRNALVTSQKCCNGFDDLTSNWYQLIDGDLYINGEKCSDRSCPFVYSKTDEGYKLEEDIIVRQTESFMSNPFFTELEYYDLKENKLLIYEHLNELSYLDQIQLVAVKHNYDAVVDVLGNFYTINNPQKVECVDDIGRDCTKMLEKEDAKIKTKSRVTELGSLNHVELIDKISFDKEAWAQKTTDSTIGFVELTLPQTDVKNSKLVISYSKNELKEATEKPEQKKNFMTEFLSKIPFFSNKFKQNYVANYMKNIVIEYLDNGQWKTYPNNHHLHSDVYKKTIIPLDMEIIKENKIRLYQRSIYVFDYIAIDYSLDEIYSVEYFKPINQEQLEDADDSEILMELDDFIELNFPKVEGDSFFLMSKGYYLPGKNKGDVE